MRIGTFALVGLLGCATTGKRARDPFATSLGASEAVWAGRGRAGGLDDAERAYAGMLAIWSEDGRVLWRMSRLEWSRAIVEPDRAATWHEAGREYAMRCLLSDQVFADSAFRVGDRIGPEALATLPTDRAPCLVFAAAHTVALAQLRGPGAALDLLDAPALLDAADRLDPNAEPALSAWTRGELGLLAGDVVAARAQFRKAVETAPGVGFYRQAALAAFPDLAGSWPPFEGASDWSAENAASRTD